MLSHTILYVIFSSASIVTTIILAFLFWLRRNSVGAKTMCVLMSCAALWSFSDLLSALSSNIHLKLFWDGFSYVGVVIIPVEWFVFSLRYTGREKLITFRNSVLLSIIPLITMLMVITNSHHHFFVSKMLFTRIGELNITDPIYGIWFWVHTAYSYLLIVIGAFILLKKLLSQPKIYKTQSTLMILATFAPFIGNIVFVFGFSPIDGFDPTVFSFIFTGLLFFIGMFRYKLFDLVPIAREAVIESMNDLIVILDPKHRIIDINKAALHSFGKIASNVIGSHVSDILGSKSEIFKNNIIKSIINDKLVTYEGNRQKIYDFKLSPLYDTKSKFSGYFIVMRDITDLENAMRELEESKQAAEDANKAKSRFLASMSHEIRTPLNGILGMSHLLSSAKLSEEERIYLKSIEYSAGSLLEIINDILDFSKIEAGKMELEEIAFNIKSLMKDVIDTFMYQKNEKGLKLETKIADSIPDYIIGDPVRIRQILINLIGNAFKFTEKGSIDIRLEKAGEKGNEILLQFSVSDTGIGIPKEKIGNLFESFRQLDSSTTRKYGGTGLGLAIVDNLISIMNGNIRVESELGEGSKFLFTIPFKLVKSYQLPAKEKEEENRDLELKGEILLAEDNRVNQLLTAKLLEKKKLKVDVVENGIRALEKVKEKDYNLIFMDIQMPIMDGFEATEAIREFEKQSGKHIPIIALTANATEGDMDRCFSSGMDDYLSKPLRPEKLYKCLDIYLNK
ncbi:MAG: histidine kinase N-terminal 7TM domain-containing protein [Bacillota bacterium]|nr:histidine kinase N-terminal 7TM domain-containing protein [Bacillota bacterium]